MSRIRRAPIKLEGLINPNILRELASRHPEGAQKARKRFKNFDKWLTGEDYPTYNQILQLSKIFDVPFGDFFLDRLPQLPLKGGKAMKKRRITIRQIIEIEKALSSLPHPLQVEREGRGPVKVVDEEGNVIQIISYNQLPALLYFIQKNCLHRDK
jgi:hypothetical protein